MAAIFFPDLSHYNQVAIEPGTVAVVAKATHGTTLVDSAYSRFRPAAEAVDAHFVAYHWLNHGNLAAQAQWCHRTVGDTPLMVDAEDMPNNTGYAGPLTVADITGFATAFRALGGVCHLVYLPHWYWADHMGSPDLRPLTAAGLHLVSSNYTSYADGGPGWAPYGGVTPTVWQYADNLPYGGGIADFNAFRGTLDQFRALTTGGGSMSQQAESILAALAEGGRTWTDDSGRQQELVPVTEIYRQIDFRQEMADRLDRLETALTTATIQSAGAPTQEQVDAAMLAALRDPTVLAGLAAAIVGHLHID